MGRVNKKTEGVFVKIFADDDAAPAFENFLKNNNPANPSHNLKKYVKMYRDYVASEGLKLEQISLVEELIMQLRAKEQMTDIKISIVRDYIYARCSFYRKDTTSKDVRVIVDNKEFWNQPIKKLSENEEFMKKAKEKLLKQMNLLIENNISKLAELQAKIEKQASKAKPVEKPKAKNVEETNNVEEPELA